MTASDAKPHDTKPNTAAIPADAPGGTITHGDGERSRVFCFDT